MMLVPRRLRPRLLLLRGGVYGMLWSKERQTTMADVHELLDEWIANVKAASDQMRANLVG